MPSSVRMNSQSWPSTSAPVRPPSRMSCSALRVGDVGRQVDQILAGPPGADRGAEGLVLSHERDRRDYRDQELQQRAAEHRHESPERREDDVSGFVEDQVGQVQKRAHRVRASGVRANWTVQMRGRQRALPRPASSFVRCRREDRQHEQTAAARIAHAVRHALGRDQQIAGLHCQFRPSSRNRPSPSITW